MQKESKIEIFKLSNGLIDIELCNYGCTIVSIFVPDKMGQKRNIVAGFKTIEEYHQNEHYFGCTVGRFANRIANGKFEIEGKKYHLECNNGQNHLHGGKNAFHKKIWNVTKSENGLSMTYFSADGEEGYPGNLNIRVDFSFGEDNKFNIHYTATTDKSTIINLTNHSYFNLSGFEESTIYNHFLKVNAVNFTPKNEKNTATGEITKVEGTPFDFRKFKPLGKDMDALPIDMGYDINFVLDNNKEDACAELFDPQSGRLLKVFTTQPGLQLYTANWWNGKIEGTQSVRYEKHGAVALETQAFPDAPNHPNFPSTILNVGEEYFYVTTYQFLTKTA